MVKIDCRIDNKLPDNINDIVRRYQILTEIRKISTNVIVMKEARDLQNAVNVGIISQKNILKRYIDFKEMKYDGGFLKFLSEVKGLSDEELETYTKGFKIIGRFWQGIKRFGEGKSLETIDEEFAMDYFLDYLDDVYQALATKGLDAEGMRDLVGELGVSFRYFMQSVVNGHVYHAIKFLTGDLDTIGMRSLKGMWEDIKHPKYKKFMAIPEKERTEFLNYFTKIGEDVSRAINGMKKVLLEAGAFYRFFAYTLNPIAGFVMSLVQTLAYKAVLKHFSGDELAKAGEIMNKYGVLPDGGLYNVNVLFTDSGLYESYGASLNRIFGYISQLVTKNPKIQEYVNAVAGGWHQLVDIYFESKLRRVAFLRAMRQYGYDNFDDLAELLERNPQFREEFTEVVTKYYEDMKGFPLLFGHSRLASTFWRGYFRVFGFMSSWGFIMMKNFLRDAFLPYNAFWKTFNETGDLKKALKAFSEGLKHERFAFQWMLAFDAALWGHRIDYVDGKGGDEENWTTEDWIEYFLQMSANFNAYLQAFESNVLGRMLINTYDAYMYDFNGEKYHGGYAIMQSFNTMMQSFLKQLKVTDPFVRGAIAYKKSIEMGASKDEAYTNAMMTIYDGFKETFSGYIRYLGGEIGKNSELYWWPSDGDDFVSFIIGDSSNEYQQKYYEMKSFEQYHKFVQDNPIRAILSYALWNTTVIKNFARDDYFDYFGEVKDLMKVFKTDDNLLKMRVLGEIPIYLSNASDRQNEIWINFLYNKLTQRAPQKISDDMINGNIVWSNKEMRLIFKNIRSALYDDMENIFVLEMIDKLEKKRYEELLQLYHSVDGTNRESYKKGLIQILGMIEANSPGSARKFLSLYAYDLGATYAKQMYGKYWSQLTPAEKLTVKQKVTEHVLPFYQYTGKNGYVDFTVFTDAASKYIEIMYPQIFKQLGYESSKPYYDTKWKSSSISQLIALDMYMAHQLYKGGDIDAYKIKNIFTKIASGIKDETLKLQYITKIISDVDIAPKLDSSTKTAIKTGILLANIDLLDNILKEPGKFKDFYDLARTLVKQLFGTLGDIKDEAEKYTQGKILEDVLGKGNTGSTYSSGVLSYNNYKPLYNNLRRYASTRRPYTSKYVGSRNYNSPSRPAFGGTGSFYRPRSSNYQPYYRKGYNLYKAISERLIRENKKPIKRSFSYKYGRHAVRKTK